VEIIQQLASVAFVFALLAGALWWLRGRKMIAFGPARHETSRLEVIDRVRLTPQHSVHLLRTGSRELTIAVHPTGCTLLETRQAVEAERQC
jgi:flagellar biogenesis protein FliO